MPTGRSAIGRAKGGARGAGLGRRGAWRGLCLCLRLGLRFCWRCSLSVCLCLYLSLWGALVQYNPDLMFWGALVQDDIDLSLWEASVRDDIDLSLWGALVRDYLDLSFWGALIRYDLLLLRPTFLPPFLLFFASLPFLVFGHSVDRL